MLLLSGQHMTSLPMRGPQKRLLELSYPPPDGGWSTPAARRGDLVKIRPSIATDHMAKWGEIRRAVQRWADGRGYLLNLVQPVVNYELGAKITLAERRDDDTLLTAYGRHRDVDEAGGS